MTVNTKALGERIKAARNRIEIGQEKLASLAVVEPSHISNLESGNGGPAWLFYAVFPRLFLSGMMSFCVTVY